MVIRKCYSCATQEILRMSTWHCGYLTSSHGIGGVSLSTSLTRSHVSVVAILSAVSGVAEAFCRECFTTIDGVQLAKLPMTHE